MTKITAGMMNFKTLNEMIRGATGQDVEIRDLNGQRYIGSGLSGKNLYLDGTPGNALGAYLDGATITVYQSAQDATGDTMNDGIITIHGSSGDAPGYGMRGGAIYIRGNVGYRAGIHMKAYREKLPAIVIGGHAGSFLGEYQAGGLIIVLGLDGEDGVPVGEFCGTGMHGGKIFLRTESLPKDLPPQVAAHIAEAADFEDIMPHIEAFCEKFGMDKEKIMSRPFYVLEPNTGNPYHQLYTYS